jgi:hypothetical protein
MGNKSKEPWGGQEYEVYEEGQYLRSRPKKKRKLSIKEMREYSDSWKKDRELKKLRRQNLERLEQEAEFEQTKRERQKHFKKEKSKKSKKKKSEKWYPGKHIKSTVSKVRKYLNNSYKEGE